jgi:hypothetical protein
MGQGVIYPVKMSFYCEEKTCTYVTMQEDLELLSVLVLSQGDRQVIRRRQMTEGLSRTCNLMRV